MGTIIGMGAKKAPSTISVEKYNELEKKIKESANDIAKLEDDLKEANDTIGELEAKNKELEGIIADSNNQSAKTDENPENKDNVDPEDPGKTDAEPNNDGSKKKTKKDE